MLVSTTLSNIGHVALDLCEKMGRGHLLSPPRPHRASDKALRSDEPTDWRCLNSASDLRNGSAVVGGRGDWGLAKTVVLVRADLSHGPGTAGSDQGRAGRLQGCGAREQTAPSPASGAGLPRCPGWVVMSNGRHTDLPLPVMVRPGDRGSFLLRGVVIGRMLRAVVFPFAGGCRMRILTRRSQLGNLELQALIGSLQPTILGHLQSPPPSVGSGSSSPNVDIADQRSNVRLTVSVFHASKHSVGLVERLLVQRMISAHRLGKQVSMASLLSSRRRDRKYRPHANPSRVFSLRQRVPLYDRHGQPLHAVLGGCRRCLTMWHALPQYPTNMTFRYRMPSPSAPCSVAQWRSAYLVYLFYLSFLPQVTAQS